MANDIPIISVDENIENADWLKFKPDLPAVQSKADLLKYLSDIGISVEDFKRLPIYLRNKDTKPFSEI